MSDGTNTNPARHKVQTLLKQLGMDEPRLCDLTTEVLRPLVDLQIADLRFIEETLESIANQDRCIDRVEWLNALARVLKERAPSESDIPDHRPDALRAMIRAQQQALYPWREGDLDAYRREYLEGEGIEPPKDDGN